MSSSGWREIYPLVRVEQMISVGAPDRALLGRGRRRTDRGRRLTPGDGAVCTPGWAPPRGMLALAACPVLVAPPHHRSRLPVHELPATRTTSPDVIMPCTEAIRGGSDHNPGRQGTRTVEVLTDEECRELLSAKSVGRLGFVGPTVRGCR